VAIHDLPNAQHGLVIGKGRTMARWRGREDRN